MLMDAFTSGRKNIINLYFNFQILEKVNFTYVR